MKFEWEEIWRSGNDRTFRAMVPHGWIIKHIESSPGDNESSYSASLVYVPDIQREWVIDDKDA